MLCGVLQDCAAVDHGSLSLPGKMRINFRCFGSLGLMRCRPLEHSRHDIQSSFARELGKQLAALAHSSFAAVEFDSTACVTQLAA